MLDRSVLVHDLCRMADHLEYVAPKAAGTDPDLVEEWKALRPRLTPEALAMALETELQPLAVKSYRLIATLASRRQRREAMRVEVELKLLDPRRA